MRNTKFVRAGLCSALLGLCSTLAVADEGSGFDPTLFGDVSAVIGGAPTTLGNFPAAVALLRVAPTSTLFQRQFCAGAAISDEFIITAAHCMFDNFGMIEPGDVLIAGDFVDLTNDSPAEIPVAQIIVHPSYDNAALFAENDIALLRTTVPHNLPLMQLFNGDARKLTGEPSLVIGWGLTSTNPEIFPTVLNSATVPITDFNTCNSVYAEGLGPEHLCAGFQQGGVDACQGDSGGPLMITADNENLQVGITSFGNGCALPDAYGVYSNVTEYESWIESTVPPPSSGEPMFDSPRAFSRSNGIAVADIGGDVGRESGGSSGGGGAVDKLLLMFLLGGVWLRFIRNGLRRKAWAPSHKLLSVVAVSAILGGCVNKAPAPAAESPSPSPSPSQKFLGETKIAGVSNVRGVNAVTNVSGTNALTIEASESHKGLPKFDEVALSEKRESVMAGATERYGVEPVCSGKKVAPKNSRRADYYELCEFTGLSKPFEGGSITAVSYHFLSNRVVQIDANLSGHAFVLAPLADSLDALLGESDFSAPESSSQSSEFEALPQAVYHWNKSPSQAFARLQTVAQADDVSFLLLVSQVSKPG